MEFFDNIPASLRTRTGWAEFLELQRTTHPHIHQIEPTNHCPYRCIMCPRHKYMTRTLGFMDFDLYAKVIDEYSTYPEPVRSKEIELFHFGESLLHPRLSEMVAYASGRDLNMTLSVNAPDLKPELSESLLKAGAFKIIISIDGHDDETYRQIRGPRADFALACEHVEHLIRTHRGLDSSTEILVRMIEMNANRDQVEEFVEHWRQEGISTEVREFFPWGEPEMAELGEFRSYPKNMPCPFPWQYLVVQWNGDVVPCCRDYNSEIAVGNVREQTLEEIWNGPACRALRRQHETGFFKDNETCRKCLGIYFTPGENDGSELPLAEREVVYWLSHIEDTTPLAARLGLTASELQSIIDDLARDGFVKRDGGDGRFLPVGRELRCPPVAADSLAGVWQRAVEKHGERPFLIDEDDESSFTYADADQIVGAMMHRLRADGITAGDRIVVWSKLHTEAILMFWAAVMIGAEVVPLDPDMPPVSAAEVLSDVAPDLVVVDLEHCEDAINGHFSKVVALDSEGETPPAVEMISDWLREEDYEAERAVPESEMSQRCGAILFTSGTTGRPKGVILAQHALAHSGRLVAESYGWGSEDRLLSSADLHTMSGLRNPCIAAVHAGASVVVPSHEVRGSVLGLAETIRRHDVTVLTLVPAAVRQLLEVADRLTQGTLGTVRQALSTGANLSKELRTRFESAFGCRLYDYYGLTETAGFCAGELPQFLDERGGIPGRPVDAILRVVDQQGGDVSPGEVGELWIQSANLMIGYLGDREETERVFSGRWFRTGDVVTADGSRHFRLIGRASEIMKNSRGEIVSLIEVRDALEAHPDVDAARIWSVADQDGIEHLEAAVVLLDHERGWELEAEVQWDLRRFVQERLGPGKLPRRIRLAASIQECDVLHSQSISDGGIQADE